MTEEKPKILVDDDWKSSAKAERERLKQQAEAKEKEAGPEGKREGPLGFSDLVQMLAMQALTYMGAFPDESGKAVVSLDVAKAHIDLLGVLEEKTKNNLTKEEDEMLTGISGELRGQFVQLVKAVETAQAEGKLGPEATGGGGASTPGPGGVPGMPDLKMPGA